jgi:chromosome segregation ATPase
MEKAAKEVQNREDIISEKNDIISRERNRVAALSVEKRNLTSQVADLNSEVSTHKNRISAFEKETASLKKTVSEKNADIEGKQKEITGLNGELDTAKKNLAAFRSKYTKTEKAMKNAQEKEKAVFAQMMAVMQERNKYKKMAEDYKKNVVPALKKQIKKLEGGEEEEKEEEKEEE